MRIETYNHEENACRIGLVLAVVAVALNTLSLYVFATNQLLDFIGVFCAIVSMLCAYLSESYHPYPQFRQFGYRLQLGCIASCVAAFAIWIISFFLHYSDRF